MWTYSQSTGALSAPDGTLAGEGYSGHPPHVNDPNAQSIPDVGPIPEGGYTIGPFFTDPEKGPLPAHCTPILQMRMFGRDGFMIHGDSILHLGERVASHGCIIMAHDVRLAVRQSGDNRLLVTA